jgi:hypothetical protein
VRLLIVAAAGDASALALARRWSDAGARLLTPEDLSVAGWRHHIGDPEAGCAVASGEVLPVASIAGVVTRLAWVSEHELAWIVAEDRAYVAAEMSAFFLGWLAELPVPVLNRPAPGCLAGPGWRHERWVHAAARLGIPTVPCRRSVGAGAASKLDVANPRASEVITITLAGRRPVGPVPGDDRLITWANALAATAGVDLLDVHFCVRGQGPSFLSANPWPDVSRPELADALLELMRCGCALNNGSYHDTNLG